MTTTKRITFRNTSSTDDYVDARFEVFLDGDLIGEVTRDRRERDVSRQESMTARMSVATLWSPVGVRYARESRTRVDAVADLLVDVKGLTQVDADRLARS